MADQQPSTNDAFGSRWRHKARGTTYRITGWATLHSRTLGVGDVVVVIYESEDDRTTWARPWTEFLDGRFEPLPLPSTKTRALAEEIAGAMPVKDGRLPGELTLRSYEELVTKIEGILRPHLG